MTSDQPVLHALSVEPCSARAGETVCAVFRTRNLGALASPPGAVAFGFGAGLEPLGPTEIAIDPVEPGAEVTARAAARVAVPTVERTEVEVGAQLRFADRVLGTNRCIVAVRSRPVLNGPASGTFVDAVDGETVRVRAVVTNEGDGPAGALRIVVPVPLGCTRDGGDVPMLKRDGLAEGESAELAFEARIAGPVEEICADEGIVELCDREERCALPVRRAVRLTAATAAPEVELIPSRRGLELAVGVRNTGWVDAREVRVRIALPDGLKAVDGSLNLDGMPVPTAAPRGAGTQPIARSERAGDARDVVIAVVPARSRVRVALAATFRPHCAAGTIRVAVNDDAIEVPFAPHHARELRVRITGTPRTVVPGETVRMSARVENLGDVAEDVTLALDRADERDRGGMRRLAAGAAMLIDVPLTIRPGVPGAGAYSATLVVRDAEGERARAAFSLPVRAESRAEAHEHGGATIAAERTATDAGDAAAFTVRFVLEPVAVAEPPCVATVEPVAPALSMDEIEPADAPVERTFRLDHARLDEIGRLLHGLRADGLVGHLFVLRLFFPDANTADGTDRSAALSAVGDALRDVFDRLFVKLRIPGYALSSEDLEDGALRAALVVLLDQLDADGAGSAPALVAVPFGAPAVLRALVSLLPTRCDDDARVAASLARHAAQLDAALGRYEGVPLEIFDDALARRSEPALEIARANLIDALAPHLATAIPC